MTLTPNTSKAENYDPIIEKVSYNDIEDDGMLDGGDKVTLFYTDGSSRTYTLRDTLEPLPMQGIENYKLYDLLHRLEIFL